MSGTFGQSRPESPFQFCDFEGPTNNETPSQAFSSHGSTPEGFQSQASSHPGCSKKLNDPSQLTRHEELHLRVGISGEEE